MGFLISIPLFLLFAAVALWLNGSHVIAIVALLAALGWLGGGFGSSNGKAEREHQEIMNIMAEHAAELQDEAWHLVASKGGDRARLEKITAEREAFLRSTERADDLYRYKKG
jgi:hypothetical protein